MEFPSTGFVADMSATAGNNQYASNPRSAFNLCAFFGRQWSTIEDDDRRDSMILEQPNAVHGIVDESMREVIESC
jgi:hypothetical protein